MTIENSNNNSVMNNARWYSYYVKEKRYNAKLEKNMSC